MQNFKLNNDKTVAVAMDYEFLPIDKNTPRGVKVLLIGDAGVAHIGIWDGKNPFYTEWFPMPKRRKKNG